MWHGNSIYNLNSYGKILPITGEERLMCDAKTLPLWQLKSMVD